MCVLTHLQSCALTCPGRFIPIQRSPRPWTPPETIPPCFWSELVLLLSTVAFTLCPLSSGLCPLPLSTHLPEQITSLPTSRNQNLGRELLQLPICLCLHPSLCLACYHSGGGGLSQSQPPQVSTGYPSVTFFSFNWFLLISIKTSSFLVHLKKKKEKKNAFPQPSPSPPSGVYAKPVSCPQGNAQRSSFLKINFVWVFCFL